MIDKIAGLAIAGLLLCAALMLMAVVIGAAGNDADRAYCVAHRGVYVYNSHQVPVYLCQGENGIILLPSQGAK